MGNINLTRVLLGGLLAGVVFNVGEGILNELILTGDWEAAMQALQLPMVGGVIQGVLFLVLGFVLGIVAVCIYASIRPRFGAGVKTAVIAGLTVWVLIYIGFGFPFLVGVFPMKLFWISAVWGLVEVPLATVAGAWVYKEDE